MGTTLTKHKNRKMRMRSRNALNNDVYYEKYTICVMSVRDVKVLSNISDEIRILSNFGRSDFRGGASEIVAEFPNSLLESLSKHTNTLDIAFKEVIINIVVFQTMQTLFFVTCIYFVFLESAIIKNGLRIV